MGYATQYAAYQQGIEGYLAGLFTAETPYTKLYEAIRYSLLSGRHRLASGAALRLCAGAGTQLLPDPRRPALHGQR